MAFVNPGTVHTPALGTLAPVSWGTAVNAAIQWLHDVPAVLVSMGTTQSIPNGTLATISWGTSAIFDPGSMYATATPDRIVIPYTGLYSVEASLEFAGNGTGTRYLRVEISGFTKAQRYEQADADGNQVNLHAQLYGTANQYFQVTAEQNCGSALPVGGSSTYHAHFSVSLIRAA